MQKNPTKKEGVAKCNLFPYASFRISAFPFTSLFRSENALISNKRLSAIVYDICPLDVRAICSTLFVEQETLCRFIRVPLGGQMNKMACVSADV